MARKRKVPTNIPDVLVVGGGGTGAVLAAECAEAGLGVVVLEAGPWHDPQRDYNGLEWDMFNQFDSVFRWGPADRTRPPWPRARDGIGVLFQTAGVGGNTLHYGANCPRAYPASFDQDWPFRYADLIPFYERVEDALPVRVPEVAARKDTLFIEGCERAGIPHLASADVRGSGWRMQPNAILPVALSGEEPAGCTQCGECIVGCRNPAGATLERSAKRSTNVSYAPRALRTGRCEFRTGAFAVKVLTDGDPPRVSGVRYRDAAGNLQEQDARVVVLAGGPVETPRLWLASGLPDNGWVGRGLTTHWFDYVSGVFPTEVGMYEGQTSMARAEFPGYGFIETQGFGPLLFALATALGPRQRRADGPFAVTGRTWGADLKRRMELFRRTLTIVAICDDEVSSESWVSLSPTMSDEHNPAPLVRYRATARTVERRDWLARRAAEVLVAAGADPSSIHRADAAPSTVHAHGTMRMGVDPSTSVVDAAGEAHGIERLFVCDTSVFSNGIGGPNPTLTAQAIATMIAGRIAERHFG